MSELYSNSREIGFPLVLGGYLTLLGLDTEVLFWILSLATIIGTVRYWHHFAIHNFKTIFIRVSLIILSNVLVVSSAGITLNRSGQFYASWDDLFGLDSNLKQKAISPENLALISRQDLQTARKTKAGSLIFKKIITGQYSGVSNYVYIVLSPKVANHLKRSKNFDIGSGYQVVELFPGFPGVPGTWLGTLDGLTAVEKMEAANQIPPTVLIIPAINVVAGLDTECLNIPGTAQVETWLTQDVKIFAQKFIGIDDRKWSTFGYSTGGWCAAEVAVRHPDQYNMAISLAGYYKPNFAEGLDSAERTSLSSEYDLVKILASEKSNLKMLGIYSGQNDFETSAMMDFKNQVGNTLNLKTIEIPQGGHNIQVWKPYVYTGFQWLAAQGPDLGNNPSGN